MDKSGKASNLSNYSFNLFPFLKLTPYIHLEKHIFLVMLIKWQQSILLKNIKISLATFSWIININ